MNKFTAYLLIAALIAITTSPVFAQQNQSTPKQEIETLKKQVLELQKQLQTKVKYPMLKKNAWNY